MKKFFYRSIMIIAILIIIVNIFSVKNKSILGFRVYRVVTGSMEPNLKVGDFILIKEQNEYDTGDIVTYSVDNEYVVTHRIVLINGNDIYTKGDANNTTDEPISKEQIIGKVIFKLQNINYLRFLFKKPVVWILILVIGILLIIIFSPKTEGKKERKERRHRHRNKRNKEREE